jgi:hypothetical protein
VPKSSTPEVFICFCGPVPIAGQPEDHAYCTECDWEARGGYADHLGTHHHHATQHTWKLTWGGKPV